MNINASKIIFFTLSTLGALVFLSSFIYLIIYSFNPDRLKNIENKLKYFKKCVDKCTSMYYIRLNKRETEQPNKEGWERSTKESIEREV